MTEAEKDWRETNWEIPEGEFAVFGKVYTDPEHTDKVEAIYRETTKRAHEEEGTLSYCLGRDPDDPSIIHFFERYTSKAAFEKHNDQQIIQDLVNSGWMKDVKAVFVKPIPPAK
ncbi:hypothetical protein PV08_07660 [Exophiala spinifera]|uniref:ABM domain-containing protein n=1 Tax=Exophiala spinifera TaxID=91928 RepID=A0A0D2B871_9EURO|nr:uncharacterized protein PV08_07660 [Exophiala spinifera]KIW14875.1 hypothetical protein PV08_07660 [Exophiala spinifera]